MQPPLKSHPPLSQQPPLKVEVKPTLFENLVEGSTLPLQKRGGGHADYEMGHLHTKVNHNIDSTDEPVVQHVPVATKYICR